MKRHELQQIKIQNLKALAAELGIKPTGDPRQPG